jgi:hypothetical protein
MPQRRFPRPWRFEPIPGGYRVTDANGLELAHVHGEPPNAIAISDKRVTDNGSGPPRSVAVVDAGVIAVPPIGTAGDHRPAMQPTAPSRVVAIIVVIAKADEATEPATMDIKIVFLEMLAMAKVTAPAKIVTSRHVVGVSARRAIRPAETTGGVVSGLATGAKLHAAISRVGTATSHGHSATALITG